MDVYTKRAKAAHPDADAKVIRMDAQQRLLDAKLQKDLKPAGHDHVVTKAEFEQFKQNMQKRLDALRQPSTKSGGGAALPANLQHYATSFIADPTGAPAAPDSGETPGSRTQAYTGNGTLTTPVLPGETLVVMLNRCCGPVAGWYTLAQEGDPIRALCPDFDLGDQQALDVAIGDLGYSFNPSRIDVFNSAAAATAFVTSWFPLLYTADAFGLPGFSRTNVSGPAAPEGQYPPTVDRLVYARTVSGNPIANYKFPIPVTLDTNDYWGMPTNAMLSGQVSTSTNGAGLVYVVGSNTIPQEFGAASNVYPTATESAFLFKTNELLANSNSCDIMDSVVGVPAKVTPEVVTPGDPVHFALHSAKPPMKSFVRLGGSGLYPANAHSFSDPAANRGTFGLRAVTTIGNQIETLGPDSAAPTAALTANTYCGVAFNGSTLDTSSLTCSPPFLNTASPGLRVPSIGECDTTNANEEGYWPIGPSQAYFSQQNLARLCEGFVIIQNTTSASADLNAPLMVTLNFTSRTDVRVPPASNLYYGADPPNSVGDNLHPSRPQYGHAAGGASKKSVAHGLSAAVTTVGGLLGVPKPMLNMSSKLVEQCADISHLPKMAGLIKHSLDKDMNIATNPFCKKSIQGLLEKTNLGIIPTIQKVIEKPQDIFKVAAQELVDEGVGALVSLF